MQKPVYTLKKSSYKLCIMTAGKGTRNWYAQFHNTNKAILPLGEKIAIEHIIDRFPKIEVVLAIGYLGQQVKDVVNAIYPDRKITFVDVPDMNKGPGYSLLCCAPHLQCPFVFSACDTIVKEIPPRPDYNWIGVSRVKDKLPYLTVATHRRQVLQVYDKGDESATNTASIGLVGVHNYKAFWKGLSSPQNLVQGEWQDTSGLNALIPHGLFTQKFKQNFTWFDIGNTEGYEYANEFFNKNVS